MKQCDICEGSPDNQEWVCVECGKIIHADCEPDSKWKWIKEAGIPQLYCDECVRFI